MTPSPRSPEQVQLTDWLGRISWLDDVAQAPKLLAAGFAHNFGRRDERPVDIKSPKQVHGTTIVDESLLPKHEYASPPSLSQIEGDGIFAEKSGIKVAIRTADCLPVLFGSTGSQPLVIAVHAGWRGLTAGILRQALLLLSARDIPHSRVRVAIGPALSAGNFEVGPEVVEVFHGPALGLTTLQLTHISTKGRGDRWHLDAQTAAALSLCNQGLDPANIEIIRVCTFRTPSLNSYRREGKGVGSNWSWIQCP